MPVKVTCWKHVLRAGSLRLWQDEQNRSKSISKMMRRSAFILLISSALCGPLAYAGRHSPVVSHGNTTGRIL